MSHTESMCDIKAKIRLAMFNMRHFRNRTEIVAASGVGRSTGLRAVLEMMRDGEVVATKSGTLSLSDEMRDEIGKYL